MNGADSYSIDISKDQTFGSIDMSAIVQYPDFAPITQLAPGTYYWRVRGRNNGSPIGVYSSVWRFQVALQSRWRVGRTLGGLDSTNRAGTGPVGGCGDTNYDFDYI